MAPVKCRRRRVVLVLVLAAVAAFLGVLLLLGSGRPPPLDDQLESSQWRDVADDDVVYADGDDDERPTERRAAARPASPCDRRIEVGVIFTKADQHNKMRPSLVRMLRTMDAHTTACVNFNMFTDDNSKPIIVQAFNKADLPGRFTVTHHAIAPMADRMRSLIEFMQVHFAPRKGTYYNDVLFFLTTTMHRSLPHLDRLIMLDIDISVRADVAQLDALFDQFAADHVMGLSLELSPVYRHVLEAYRALHPNTTAGGAPPAGFPGLNSGVVLLHLTRMRSSARYNELMTVPEMRRRVQRYSFKGHLGDQDLYTLLALDDRQLFFTLPCGWNRQLCQFWRPHHPDMFDEYFRCDGHVALYHGNCKAAIPTDGERRL